MVITAIAHYDEGEYTPCLNIMEKVLESDQFKEQFGSQA